MATGEGDWMAQPVSKHCGLMRVVNSGAVKGFKRAGPGGVVVYQSVAMLCL